MSDDLRDLLQIGDVFTMRAMDGSPARELTTGAAIDPEQRFVVIAPIDEEAVKVKALRRRLKRACKPK